MIRFRRLASVASAAILVLAVSMPLPAAAQTIKQLQRKLAERDAVIADLLQRVEALERRVPPARTEAEPREAASPPASTETDNAASSAPNPQEPTGTALSTDLTPGQFTVDEEAVERALERALVQTGALLLDPGKAEIQPSFSYAHRDEQARPIFADNFLANLESRSDRLQASLSLRFGLPFDSQVEFDLPYAIPPQELT